MLFVTSLMINSNGTSKDKVFIRYRRDDGDGFKLEQEDAVVALEIDGLGHVGPGPSVQHQIKSSFMEHGFPMLLQARLKLAFKS